jgi:integrase
MSALSVLDAAGRRRSPATLPGYHAGRPPRNKGIRYPADPPTVDEIVAVMRHTGDDRHGWLLRAMIVMLWRAGLRIQEALALAEHDLDHRRGSVLVRRGKGGRRPRGGDRRLGLGGATPVADRARRVAGRAVVLCHRRTHPRAAVVQCRGPQRVSPGTPTSAPPASTSKASTPRRSSPPSEPDGPR